MIDHSITKTMKATLLTAFSLLAMLAVRSQQLQSSSLYELQGMLQNPSTAGTQEYNFVGATYKTQWNGIPGSPQTATIFGSFDLPKQKIGIGGYIFNDKTGPSSRSGVVLSLAKHIVMNNGDKLSLGIENKLQQYSLDLSKFATFGSDPVLAGSGNKFAYDAGFGMSYSNSKLLVGASVSQLVQSQLNFYSGNLTRSEEARLYRHYYLHGSYKIRIDDITTITPSAVFTYLTNAPSELQIGARVEHNNYFWYGAGYRLDQSFMLSAGFNIHKKLVIGYAYDDYITPISSFSEGGSGHEILLRYNFSK